MSYPSRIYILCVKVCDLGSYGIQFFNLLQIIKHFQLSGPQIWFDLSCFGPETGRDQMFSPG